MSTSGEQELATKTLHIQQKRFYLDVKENARGRFIKIAEVGSAGRKNRLMFAMSTAKELKDHLTAFNELYVSLGPTNPDSTMEDGLLKSEMLTKDIRRYYLDLKENSRGRFLRISQTTRVGQNGPRLQIAIPAQGMIEFRDALTDLLEEFATGDDDAGLEDENNITSNFKGELPESNQIHCDNKKFFFDIGQNSLGAYMRISEVRQNYRSTITIPDKQWVQMRDVLSEYVEKLGLASSDLSAEDISSNGLKTGNDAAETSNVSN